MINKEFGSDFHYIYDDNVQSNVDNYFSGPNLGCFFSGRVALYNLLKCGHEKYKWSKVGFPSYYCHEVVDFCRNLPLEIEYYNYNPFGATAEIEWEDRKDAVFINVDFFGISKLDCSFLKNTVVIEDLTHNLMSLSKSTASYCFGSLRKQLPLAAGGFAWSKQNDFRIEVKNNAFSNHVAIQKLTAMYLKGEYLEDRFVDKDIFRKLYIDAEEQFGDLLTNVGLPKMIQVQLENLNPEKLISRTRENIRYAKTQLESSGDIVLIEGNPGTEMGLMFLCRDHTLREQFRTYLITNNIFPAVLWPNQIHERDLEIQHRVLFVHADFRYNQKDIDIVVDIINKFIKHV